MAATVIALLAVRDAVVDARQLRSRYTDPTAGSLLSGAVYAIAGIQLLVNRPGPTGTVLSLVLAVGIATMLRRPSLVPPARTPLGGRIRTAAVLAGTAGAVLLFAVWQGRSSTLPDSYSLMPAGHQSAATQSLAEAIQARHGTAMPGHSTPADSSTGEITATDRMVSVADLGAGPATGAIRKLTITAQIVGDRWVFQPGELRVHRGDRVEITVVNRLPESTSVHWHGVNVPGREDGVPGLTQDAISPGTSRVYEFDAADVGTFWFHSHQNSLEQIAKGMFGALVVLPDGGVPEDVDRVVTLHTWPGTGDVALADGTGSTSAPARTGAGVRLRVINTDDIAHRIDLRGASFRVVALDGHDLSGPAPITETAIDVPAGGRVDLSYEQPATPVALRSGDAAFRSGPADADAPGGISNAVFDPMTYGENTTDTVTRGAEPDVRFQVVAENRLGWYDGAFGARVALNGRLYPDGEMLMVRPGQLAQVTVINRSFVSHPMHLHGHFFSVLARNDQARSGSPLRLDSIEVAPGESVVLAFRADNPGLWMFHCHNGFHAAAGMDLMVGYEGVMTPFRAGAATGNAPQ
ncbi:multicopper oxidase family protein [Nakamurella sp. GG22]